MDDDTIDDVFSSYTKGIRDYVKTYRFRDVGYSGNYSMICKQLENQFGYPYNWRNNTRLKSKWTSFFYRPNLFIPQQCFLFLEKDDFIFFKLLK